MSDKTDGLLNWKRYSGGRSSRPGFGKFELDGRIVISGVCPDPEVNREICERYNGGPQEQGPTKGFFSPFPCPKCHAATTGVVKTEHNTSGEIIRRRRCRMCEHAFITTESITTKNAVRRKARSTK